jgi:acetyl-CoA synthetase
METQGFSPTIDALSTERRLFAPPPALAARALAKHGIHAAGEDAEAFWASWAKKLAWIKPFTRTLEWEEPYARWFGDGRLNASANALDRHVVAGRGERVAYYFEGERGDRESVTYTQLLERVCRLANGLRELGVSRGDRVAIYLPMIIELPVAVLACARIGAIHSVIFAGFSADAIADRVNDSGCVALITADGGLRRGKKLPLKTVCNFSTLLGGLPRSGEETVAP